MFCLRRFSRLSLCCAALAAMAAANGAAQSAAPLPSPNTPAATPESKAPELRVFDPSLIDKSVDPCENFYQYSCKGWFARNPLPADQGSYGRFTELAEQNELHLRQILEAAQVVTPSRTANQQKIGDEYASCMDVAATNAKGLMPLQPELQRIAALHSIGELPALLAYLHSIGVHAFFRAGSDQNLADASSVIEAFSAGGLGLPERDFYTRMDPKSVEIRNKYVAHVARMLALLGEPETAAEADAASILALETRLAKAQLTITEERDPQNLNHPSDVATFAKQLPNFAMAAYLEALHAPTQGKVNVEQPRYFAELNEVVADTPIATIQTYLRWQLIHALSGTSLPQSFDAESWNFYSHTLRGAEKQQDRWKRCTQRVDRELGEALGQVYVAKYFPPTAKQHALEMTLAIERAMDKDIDQLDWMSAETKVRAKEKLHTVVNRIGYPNKWRDYSKVDIVRGDALGNQLRVAEFNEARDLAKIGKPVDKDEWYMTPPTVNAYYEPQMNNVNFPAGYFQPPFFSDAEDDAANYGDMGSTIGHELTHGFDDEGRQFDKDGNLKEWWTKEDEQKFTARAACMVNQYDAIEAVPGVHLNGKLTLGENLADLGGLWLAWLAWLDKAQAEHVDWTAQMDGYTPDQRFWIAYAQQWCTQTRPEALRTAAQTDPHAPDEDRTNAVLADLPEFAKSFRCKKNQAMVSANPCRVW